MTGIRREKRNKGSHGKNGAPGMRGIKRDKGDEGSRGSSGPPGIKGVKEEQGSKGEKGEIVNSAVSQTNWKQCVWKNDDGRDSGKIKVRKYKENLQFIPCITIIGNFSSLIVLSCCFLVVVVPTNPYLFFLFRNPFLITDVLRFLDRMAYQECREFLTPQGRKDNKEKMELRGSLVSRDRSDRDAPGMIGLKGDKYNVGCSRGRCF